MYKFNYILYMILAVVFGSSKVLACITPALACAAVLLVCTGIPLVIAYIVIAGHLYSGVAKVCAANKFIYNIDEELSFEEDAKMMKGLWIL